MSDQPRPRGRPKSVEADPDIRAILRRGYNVAPLLDRGWDHDSILSRLARQGYLQMEDAVADNSGDSYAAYAGRQGVDKTAAADKIDANYRRQAERNRQKHKRISPDRPQLKPRKVRRALRSK